MGKKQNKKAQVFLDIIMPSLILNDPDMPTNEEARSLYDMWKCSEPGHSKFSCDNMSMVNAWKTKGLVDGISEELTLTQKGRRVLMDMAIGEPNQFEKKAMPSYSQIKTRKGKKDTGNTKTAFNLKERRDG